MLQIVSMLRILQVLIASNKTAATLFHGGGSIAFCAIHICQGRFCPSYLHDSLPLHQQDLLEGSFQASQPLQGFSLCIEP